jgi:predicted metal-dependent hydrolase
MAPPEVIDYLIIHEISHLKHMNHSGVFWQRVERFCPHHRQHRGWLKKNGHRIWLD